MGDCRAACCVRGVSSVLALWLCGALLATPSAWCVRQECTGNGVLGGSSGVVFDWKSVVTVTVCVYLGERTCCDFDQHTFGIQGRHVQDEQIRFLMWIPKPCYKKHLNLMKILKSAKTHKKHIFTYV